MTVVVLFVRSFTSHPCVIQFPCSCLILSHAVTSSHCTVLCEEIDVGESVVRTIASGIRPHYSAEDLVNRKVCVLANLKDRNLAGFKSQVGVRAGTRMGIVYIIDPALQRYSILDTNSTQFNSRLGFITSVAILEVQRSLHSTLLFSNCPLLTAYIVQNVSSSQYQ